MKPYPTMAPRKSRGALLGGKSVIVFRPQMGNDVFPHHPAQRVLQLHQLNEQIVFWIKVLRSHGALEIKAQPLLRTVHVGPLREVEEEGQIEHDGRRQDRIAAKEVDLELHRVAEPAEEVDVVPALLRVAARRVVVDANLVDELGVEVRVEIRLQNMLENSELRDLFGAEAVRIVEHLSVSVAEDVRTVPAVQAEHPRLQARREDGLQQCLSGLEVLPGDRNAALAREFPGCRKIDA